MGKFVDNVKAGFWNLFNAPGTVPVDDGDDEWEDDDHDRYKGRDMDDDYEDDRQASGWGGGKRGQTSRQAQNNKVLEMHGKTRTAPTAEVVLSKPADMGECPKICDYIRDDKICIIDLTGMERDMAQRIADFLGGACYALDGSIQRISRDIFIVVPEGVRVSQTLQEEIERSGYAFPGRAR